MIKYLKYSIFQFDVTNEVLMNFNFVKQVNLKYWLGMGGTADLLTALFWRQIMENGYQAHVEQRESLLLYRERFVCRSNVQGAGTN